MRSSLKVEIGSSGHSCCATRSNIDGNQALAGGSLAHGRRAARRQSIGRGRRAGTAVATAEPSVAGSGGVGNPLVASRRKTLPACNSAEQCYPVCRLRRLQGAGKLSTFDLARFIDRDTSAFDRAGHTIEHECRMSDGGRMMSYAWSHVRVLWAKPGQPAAGRLCPQVAGQSYGDLYAPLRLARHISPPSRQRHAHKAIWQRIDRRDVSLAYPQVSYVAD